MLDRIEDWALDNLGWLLTGVIVSIIAFAIALCWSDSRDPHISLNKTEWHCSHSHTLYLPITSGKTTIIVPEEICDTYRMNGYD